VPVHQISVCICTFKRPELLGRLLATLENQRTYGLFTYSVVVVDNDRKQSAQNVVTAFASATRLNVTYCVEAQQNIALARNCALQHAEGDFIAFIDDDEFPASDWLANLLQAQEKFSADGVLGPVEPDFECDPPAWVKNGKFFERPNYETGYKVKWDQARTGNVLFRRSILEGISTPFAQEFSTAGEDVDFFRRMMDKGCSFVWCKEAVAYEVVPSSRCTRTYLLKRALLRGSNFHKHPSHRFRNAIKSLIAVPSYTLALPVLAMFGQHVFLRYLIKLLDHSSRLLAYLGLSLVTRRDT
jgi:succinoglycan biosynthesis protein ExoM